MLVIGSQNPWLETVILRTGAGHVTTVDYNEIVSEDPDISTLTAPALARRYLEGSLPAFDVAVTYSSVEHSGLGR